MHSYVLSIGCRFVICATSTDITCCERGGVESCASVEIFVWNILQFGGVIWGLVSLVNGSAGLHGHISITAETGISPTLRLAPMCCHEVQVM